MRVTITENGQLTIPKQLRRQLGLKPGSVIDVRKDGNRLIGEVRVDATEAVESVKGIIKKRVDVDQAMDELRGPVL